MSNKNLLTILAVVIALGIIGGVVYYLHIKNQAALDSTTADAQSINDLNHLLETAPGIPDIKAPSANPIDAVTSSTNPLDATNPFTTHNDYQNPFN